MDRLAGDIGGVRPEEEGDHGGDLVEPAEARDGGGAQASRRRLVGEIAGLDLAERALGGAFRRHSLGAPAPAASMDEEAYAGRRDAPADRGADATAGAGDKDGPRSRGHYGLFLFSLSPRERVGVRAVAATPDATAKREDAATTLTLPSLSRWAPPSPVGRGEDAPPASSSQLMPWPRGARRVAEIAGGEAGVEPGDEAVDVVDRQADMLAQGACVGRHVGAFEQHGAGLGVAFDQRLAGVDYVLLGRRDVEHRLVADYGAAEFASAIGAGEGRVGIDAGGGETLRRQARGGRRPDGDALARPQPALDH